MTSNTAAIPQGRESEPWLRAKPVEMALPRFQLRSPYIYLSVILLSSILFTAYLVGTDREVFATLRQPLPSFGGGSHNPPPVEKPVGFHYNTAAVDVTIPPGVRIIGLVFFGRRELVKILDCYLKVSLLSLYSDSNHI